ncbi:MAG: TetR family transcriptional regulator [Magnetococcales bacterium]|nr:TetR family transcriptional regulator [Magnetococcales bacterium]
MSLIEEQSADKSQEETKIDRRRRPERRLEILKAVMTLLEKGNRRVTTAELAAEVGLSEAALYRHFTGMNAIFQALTELLREQLLHTTGNDAVAGSPLRQLQDQLTRHLNFFAAHPGLCRIFLVEGVMTRAESLAMAEIVRDFERQTQKTIVAARDANELPAAVDPESATRFFVGLIQAAALRYVLSGFSASPVSGIASIWGYFCRGVGAVEQG